jgi:hypothetical protein
MKRLSNFLRGLRPRFGLVMSVAYLSAATLLVLLAATNEETNLGRFAGIFATGLAMPWIAFAALASDISGIWPNPHWTTALCCLPNVAVTFIIGIVLDVIVASIRKAAALPGRPATSTPPAATSP